MQNEIDRCLILMAGRGSRFLPATKAVAKELFPIYNKPTLLYQLSEVYRSGIKKIGLVISKEKASVKDFLKHDEKLEQELRNLGREGLLTELNEIIDNTEIEFIYQGKLNGSGGAIYAAKKWSEGKPFALLFGDDLCVEPKGQTPTIGQLAKAFQKAGKMVIGAKPFPLEVINKYSSIVKGKKLFNGCYEMNDIIEKPEIDKAPSNLVGLARYILTPDIFPEILKCPRFENGEIRITDAMQNLAKQGKAVCYEFDARYYDCGNKLEFTKCLIDFALKDKEICENLKDFMRSKVQ